MGDPRHALGRPSSTDPEASQSRTARGGAGRFGGWRGRGGRQSRERRPVRAQPRRNAPHPVRQPLNRWQRRPRRRTRRRRCRGCADGRFPRWPVVRGEREEAPGDVRCGSATRRQRREVEETVAGCSREADETRGWTQRAPPPRPVPRVRSDKGGRQAGKWGTGDLSYRVRRSSLRSAGTW